MRHMSLRASVPGNERRKQQRLRFSGAPEDGDTHGTASMNSRWTYLYCSLRALVLLKLNN